MSEFVAVVVKGLPPDDVEVLRESPGPFRGVGDPIHDAAHDPCGPLQEPFVIGRLMGHQVGLRRIHVDVLTTVGLDPVEFTVEDINARAVGLRSELLDNLQGRCRQILAPGNPDDDHETGAEQGTGLSVEFPAEVGRIASGDREPPPVLCATLGATRIEADVVPDHIPGSGTSLHGRYGRAVQHLCSQP